MFRLEYAFFAMVAVIAASNVLVLFPINDWLTWGAFPYTISFLVTELTTRFHGPAKARKIVYAGFAAGVAISTVLSTPRIAVASALAFLFSQLLDIAIFTRLRQSTKWWLAPLAASMLASAVDSGMFWSFAFFGEDLPFVTWAIGDTFVKFAVDLALLLPFRMAINRNLAGASR